MYSRHQSTRITRTRLGNVVNQDFSQTAKTLASDDLTGRHDLSVINSGLKLMTGFTKPKGHRVDRRHEAHSQTLTGEPLQIRRNCVGSQNSPMFQHTEKIQKNVIFAERNTENTLDTQSSSRKTKASHSAQCGTSTKDGVYPRHELRNTTKGGHITVGLSGPTVP